MWNDYFDGGEFGVHSFHSNVTFHNERVGQSVAGIANPRVSQHLHSQQISNCVIFFGHYKRACIGLFTIWLVHQSLCIRLVLPSPWKVSVWGIRHSYRLSKKWKSLHIFFCEEPIIMIKIKVQSCSKIWITSKWILFKNLKLILWNDFETNMHNIMHIIFSMSVCCYIEAWCGE